MIFSILQQSLLQNVTSAVAEMSNIRLMLGYCAFGRGQPKRAERDDMRTIWLGSCSWQVAQARTLRPWDKAGAPPTVEMPGLPARLPSLVHLTRTCTPLRRRLRQVSRKHAIVMADPDMPGSAAR